MQLILVLFLANLSSITAFRGFPSIGSAIKLSTSVTSLNAEPAEPAEPAAPIKRKGFGKVVEPTNKKEEEKDIGTITYEKQASKGVPEYNIFIRPVNGTETDWVPVGSMTIPRDRKVNVAIFEVEKELVAGAFKLYPKLKSYSVGSKTDSPFEYGYILKAFPDEAIKVAIKEDESAKKNFFTNWLEKITNPMDTSSLNNPGQMTLKQ